MPAIKLINRLGIKALPIVNKLLRKHIKEADKNCALTPFTQVLNAIIKFK